jgi:kynurenine formamidase
MFKGQIIDLTRTLIPGKEERRLEIRRIVYELDKTFMHEIDTMSHIGTHVEAPSHFNKNWKDISQIPVSSFIGEAVCIDLGFHEAKEAIEPRDIERSAEVKKGDIVLLHSPYKGDDRPYISHKTARWFREKEIKMLGIDDTVRLEESYELMTTHKELLGNDIPIIEGLCNLDKVAGKSFYLIALPLKVVGLDSSPVRAIALLSCKL